MIKLVVELEDNILYAKDKTIIEKVTKKVLSDDEFYNKYLDALDAVGKDDLVDVICDCDTTEEDFLSCITVLENEITLNPDPIYDYNGNVFNVPYLLDEEKLERIFREKYGNC